MLFGSWHLVVFVCVCAFFFDGGNYRMPSVIMKLDFRPNKRNTQVPSFDSRNQKSCLKHSNNGFRLTFQCMRTVRASEPIVDFVNPVSIFNFHCWFDKQTYKVRRGRQSNSHHMQSEAKNNQANNQTNIESNVEKSAFFFFLILIHRISIQFELSLNSVWFQDDCTHIKYERTPQAITISFDSLFFRFTTHKNHTFNVLAHSNIYWHRDEGRAARN